MQPQTGERVAHYQLQARLATGGMGVVYRAFDERTKRLVALKVLSTQFGSDPDYRARFAHEAELAARVEHPNIVPIYDVGGYPNLYIAMRLVPGTDLATVLRDGPLKPERVLDIAESVAAALDEAHRHRLVHRDVKPGNVLLAPTRDRHRFEHIYLTDFGIARSLTMDLQLSKPVVVLGSPAYMAPERLAGEPGGATCDVYGLACVLYECLTGRRPFPPTATAEEVTRRAAVDPPRLASLRPDLPPGLDDALFRAMSRDPRHRPATAGDLAAAARGSFARAAPLPPPPAPPYPPMTHHSTAPYPRSAPPPAPLPGHAPPPGHVPQAPAHRPGSRRLHRKTSPQGPPRRRRRGLLVVLALLLGGSAAVGIAASQAGGSSEPAATRALVARLPTDVYGACEAMKAEPGVTAVVHCAGNDPRVKGIEVRQLPGQAALDSRFQALTADRQLVTRRCAGETGNSGTFWTSGGARQGAFACYTDASGHRSLLWQYAGQSLEVRAETDDGSPAAALALYDWWNSGPRNRPPGS